jgi:ABC-type amino acid transport substrate-binding protein
VIPFARALLVAGALSVAGSAIAQGTLERIAERSELRVGYREDARPLSFKENGAATGYSVEMCRRIAAEIRDHLKLADMKVSYVPITAENRFEALQKGDIDIECGATTVTMQRQEMVDFTLMTFVTGGAILSSAKNRIDMLSDLAGKRVAVMRGTSTADALQAFLTENLIDARVVMVDGRDDAMKRLRRGDVDAVAGDQIVLLGDALTALEDDDDASFSFADELFSYEPYAFMVRRNDADFRLVVNRALAEMFRNGQQAQLYQTWVGNRGVKPSPLLIAMYQVQSISE